MFGWIFYVKPSFWPVKRYIDFEKTIYENEIDDRSVIVAKRVVEDRFVQPEIYLTQEGPEEPAPVAKNPMPKHPPCQKACLGLAFCQIRSKLAGQITAKGYHR